MSLSNCFCRNQNLPQVFAFPFLFASIYYFEGLNQKPNLFDRSTFFLDSLESKPFLIPLGCGMNEQGEARGTKNSKLKLIFVLGTTLIVLAIATEKEIGQRIVERSPTVRHKSAKEVGGESSSIIKAVEEFWDTASAKASIRVVAPVASSSGVRKTTTSLLGDTKVKKCCCCSAEGCCCKCEVQSVSELSATKPPIPSPVAPGVIVKPPRIVVNEEFWNKIKDQI